MKVYLYIPDKGTMEEFQENESAFGSALQKSNEYFTLYEDGDVLHNGTNVLWENLPENVKAAFTLVRNL